MVKGIQGHFSLSEKRGPVHDSAEGVIKGQVQGAQGEDQQNQQYASPFVFLQEAEIDLEVVFEIDGQLVRYLDGGHKEVS